MSEPVGILSKHFRQQWPAGADGVQPTDPRSLCAQLITALEALEAPPDHHGLWMPALALYAVRVAQAALTDGIPGVQRVWHEREEAQEA